MSARHVNTFTQPLWCQINTLHDRLSFEKKILRLEEEKKWCLRFRRPQDDNSARAPRGGPEGPSPPPSLPTAPCRAPPRRLYCNRAHRQTGLDLPPSHPSIEPTSTHHTHGNPNPPMATQVHPRQTQACPSQPRPTHANPCQPMPTQGSPRQPKATPRQPLSRGMYLLHTTCQSCHPFGRLSPSRAASCCLFCRPPRPCLKSRLLLSIEVRE